MLTSLVLGGLHQRTGVALPTGGRADPAIGNETLAGTKYIRMYKYVVHNTYPTLKPIFFHTKTKMSGTNTHFFLGMYQVSIRNSLRSNNDVTTAVHAVSPPSSDPHDLQVQTTIG